ncbi:hypothetical protein ABPG74_022128 [Tetrahymena malaccensis]
MKYSLSKNTHPLNFLKINNQNVPNLIQQYKCRKNDIKQQGASNLAQALIPCSNLKELSLDLRGNQIGCNGSKNLVIGLANCSKLQTLSLLLGQNNIKEEGATVLGSTLSKGSKIKILNINLKQTQYV